ncbi:MAG: N-acetylmuramoyl-L-alanine amidase [Candidatus Udaeobacter sp.]
MPTNLYRLRLAASLLIVFLQCVVFSTAQAKRASRDSGSTTTVVIDAGHGGYDRGGIPGQRVSEKDMTLDVAQRLKKVLAANGYRVVMTRDSDVFVPLGTRVAITNSYPNAIFVSVHFNSAKRSGAGGIETYFYSRESLPLASAIHYYVAGGAPSSNRNVRRRGYFVLRKTNVPAVLVECGFLTNPTEAALAQTASYRQKLAEEIAAGIRGRNTVGSPLSTTRVATGESIPLQPYIDQTKVSKSEHRKSKRSHKKSTRRKKSSSKSGGSEAKTSSKNQEG